MRRKRVASIILFLLFCLCITAGFWLRAKERQYVLNRQLIAALVKGDDKQTLALVNAGADPNTRYATMPMPSLPELITQLFHPSTPTANHSPTAFLIACGAYWQGEPLETYEAQRYRPDDTHLVQAMLRHSANVDATDEQGITALIWAA